MPAIAPFAKAAVTIRGIAHTRLQETDRATAMATELRRSGSRSRSATTAYTSNRRRHARYLIRTYDDHCIAMAFAVIGLSAPGIANRSGR